MLTTESRPRTFAQVVGQDRTIAILRSVLASDTLPSTFIFSGAYGSGKRLPLATPVLTPEGWVPIGNLSVGDMVLGVDGQAYPVYGVSDPVTRPTYRVSFNDGSWVDADGDHLWEVQNRKGLDQVLSTEQIWDRMNGRQDYSIPLMAPAQHPTKDLPLDPYLLGCLIADGHLHGRTVQWTKEEDSVVQEFTRIATLAGYDLVDYTPEKGTRRQRFRGTPDIRVVLDELGLCVPSSEKFIPEEYFTASVAQRTALMHGLFDGDGRLSNRGRAMYHTTSERLAQDVVRLLWSLGIFSKVVGFMGDKTWRVGVLDGITNPFQFSAHRETCNTHRVVQRYHRRVITRIIPVGDTEGRCIAVDSPRSLYVTKDYIVTHNTTCARILAAQVNCRDRVNGDNCGECDTCAAIAQGASDALVEIDSAVYGGVDHVRTLTELVEYSTPYDYRVVVLDEAHSLSRQAFNALLKVMEEAPENVIFVLVTTELDKMPLTVQSRALPFYFGPVPPVQIAERLRELADRQGIPWDRAGIDAIANQAPSLRDAVKTLELVTSVRGRVELDAVTEVLGTEEPIKDVLRAVILQNEWDSAFDVMVATTSPAQVVEVCVDILTKSMFKSGRIRANTYKAALDIVWTLTPVTVFDYRGRTLARLMFRRLEALFATF